MSQFGSGAIVAPLVGLSGSHDALPMGMLIGVCGVSALVVNLLFSTTARVRDTASVA